LNILSIDLKKNMPKNRRGSGLPVFECKVCGRKVRLDFELCCTGDVKHNVEKAPWCCGKEMIESIDD
jgi:hypothetical protein